MENIKTNPGDPVGLETLEALASADRFNEWMYDTIKTFCPGPVFEIGSGIGNISSFFVRDGQTIFLSDLRPEYCDLLSKKFKGQPHLLGLEQMDLVDPLFDQKYMHLFEQFQSVYALNVVEHIEDDALAMQNAVKLLKKGGQITILVPAFAFLFNAFDTELGHYRRYNKKTLSALFQKTNLQITHKQYFNLPAILGWFWYGTVLKKKIIPEGPVRTYDKLVPIFKWADRLVWNQVGNTVILVGKKN